MSKIEERKICNITTPFDNIEDIEKKKQHPLLPIIAFIEHVATF